MVVFGFDGGSARMVFGDGCYVVMIMLFKLSLVQ